MTGCGSSSCKRSVAAAELMRDSTKCLRKAQQGAADVEIGEQLDAVDPLHHHERAAQRFVEAIEHHAGVG